MKLPRKVSVYLVTSQRPSYRNRIIFYFRKIRQRDVGQIQQNRSRELRARTDCSRMLRKYRICQKPCRNVISRLRVHRASLQYKRNDMCAESNESRSERSQK
ncbi:hypothetical protein PUN28_016688 [Cardiocondyla obscurior]|uniref:Ribosomal protein S14 n=1 Tax=Cardiocondyla obscurior TaxID=286306 RepID=A0AAW2END8_9HYME